MMHKFTNFSVGGGGWDGFYFLRFSPQKKTVTTKVAVGAMRRRDAPAELTPMKIGSHLIQFGHIDVHNLIIFP